MGVAKTTNGRPCTFFLHRVIINLTIKQTTKNYPSLSFLHFSPYLHKIPVLHILHFTVLFLFTWEARIDIMPGEAHNNI